MVVHAFNPSLGGTDVGNLCEFKDSLVYIVKTLSVAGYVGIHRESQDSGGRDRQFSEFKSSLVYTVSSRIAKATQRNPVWKKKRPCLRK